MAYVNAACTGRVTIFSAGGKFRPVLNFTQLHALTLAACSYALLRGCDVLYIQQFYYCDYVSPPPANDVL